MGNIRKGLKSYEIKVQ